VRLRIVKRLRGEIDGVSLEPFLVGETYEVGTRLGSYLLALRAAVPAGDAGATPARPGSSKDRARAADGGRSRRKLKRKSR